MTAIGRGWGWLRGGLTRVPTAGYVCALIALLNALTWSLIVPVFQVPDEPAHVAYAQYIAETGKPPSRGAAGQGFSRQERNLVRALDWKRTAHRLWNRPPATHRAHERLERTVDRPAATVRRGPGGGTVINYSPIYYAGAAAAYRLSPASDLFDRVHAMRVFSALLVAATVLFSFMFLRELLPGTPWAWTVGALAIAFQPLMGFIGGGVNNDNLISCAAAGTLMALAICFRVGLTVRTGLILGGFVALGLLAKPSMVGMAPGVAVGIGVMLLRAAPGDRRGTLRGAAAVTLAVATPLVIYVGLNSAVWDRGLFFAGPGVGEVPGTVSHVEPASLSGRLDYLWQFYLPQVPGMTRVFPYYPLKEVWFDGFIGRFGWGEVAFAGWAYNVALWVFAAVLAFAVRGLIISREVLRGRLGELLTYVTIAAGLLLLLNWIGYDYHLQDARGFEQARYLLPLLALYGGLVALAARGVGRRYGPAAGAILVSVAIAHSLLAMLVTVTRYYG